MHDYSRPGYLMLPHPLTNFETQSYYQNDLYSRNNLAKVKDGAYVTNLDEFKSIETRWIDSSVNGEKVIYFDCFGVEYIAKEIKKIIGNENILIIIYRIQA